MAGEVKEHISAGLAALNETLKGLGFGGQLCLLWTVVVCVALANGDKPLMDSLWSDLWWTWIGTATIWVVGASITAFAKWREPETKGPVVAQRKPRRRKKGK